MDFAVGEPRRWLEDPEEALLPEAEWPSEPEKAKIYCDEGVWPCLVHLAFKRGVLDAFGHTSKEVVFAPHGKPCTVGCFGVVRLLVNKGAGVHCNGQTIRENFARWLSLRCWSCCALMCGPRFFRHYVNGWSVNPP